MKEGAIVYARTTGIIQGYPKQIGAYGHPTSPTSSPINNTYLLCHSHTHFVALSLTHQVYSHIRSFALVFLSP